MPELPSDREALRQQFVDLGRALEFCTRPQVAAAGGGPLFDLCFYNALHRGLAALHARGLLAVAHPTDPAHPGAIAYGQSVDSWFPPSVTVEQVALLNEVRRSPIQGEAPDLWQRVRATELLLSAQPGQDGSEPLALAALHLLAPELAVAFEQEHLSLPQACRAVCQPPRTLWHDGGSPPHPRAAGWEDRGGERRTGSARLPEEDH